MPELPDVEGYRRFLSKHAQGRLVTAVRVLDREIVRNRTPQGLGRALAGHRFAEPGRHGKWLIAPVGQAQLLLHFGMTGELRWADSEQGRDCHDRMIFVCSGGELREPLVRRDPVAGLRQPGHAGEQPRPAAPCPPVRRPQFRGHESIRCGRVPHGQKWLTRVRDDRQASCPRCGAHLRRGTVAGRTACWCPREQRR